MKLPKKIKNLIPYYSYTVHFSNEDDAYLVSVRELPGFMTHGDSGGEALETAYIAVEYHLEVMLAQKIKIPKPFSKK